MRSGHGLLVDFGHEVTDFSELSNLVKGKAWYQIDYIGKYAKDDLGFRALLVHPHGDAAWAAEKDTLDLDNARAILSLWLDTGA